MKSNINKIHSDLLLIEGIGETVSIAEKSSRQFGSYFEMVAELSGMVAKMIIEKSDIESASFRWRYYANPEDESAGLVERNSTTDSFASDLMDIFEKSRFDGAYLSKIEK